MVGFSVVTVNDEHAKPRFKRKRTGEIEGGYMHRIIFKALV